jgi:hypothetical protein
MKIKTYEWLFVNEEDMGKRYVSVDDVVAFLRSGGDAQQLLTILIKTD